MNSRSSKSYETFIQDFIKFDIWVACPFCSGKARVKTGNYDFKKADEDKIRFICSECGHNKKLSEKPDLILYVSNKNTIKGKIYNIGGPTDPFFQLPVWLQSDFEGNVLWAYNPEHLDFLEQHIFAKMRQRNRKAGANKSLGSRLPAWMTSAKNRDAVLKKIMKMKEQSE